MIIAVDGPAASGKGTIAKALAAHYELPYLDTGLLYRAVGLTVLRHHRDPANEADAIAACDFPGELLGDPALKTEVAGAAASIVSAHPAVRQHLLERQRVFANQPDGAVLDGRDIGTVIAPSADAKLFIKATPAVRARRRHDELVRLGETISYDKVLLDIRERDRRDMLRSAAPLAQADDAQVLDTSYLDVAAAIEHAIRIVDACIAES